MRMAEGSRPRPKSTSGFEAEEDENDEDLENFIDGIVKELDAAEDGEDLAGLPDFKPDDLLGIGAVDATGNIGAATPPEVASPKAAPASATENNSGGVHNLKSIEENAKNDAQNSSASSSSSGWFHIFFLSRSFFSVSICVSTVYLSFLDSQPLTRRQGSRRNFNPRWRPVRIAPTSA